MSSEFSIDQLLSESLVDADYATQRSYVSYHDISSQATMIYPSIDLGEDDVTVFLNFSSIVDDGTEEIVSLKTSEIFYKREESGYKMDKLVHDFTFGFLAQTTDVPLSTYVPDSQIPRSRRDHLRKTPDYIAIIDGVTCLVEFGTVSSNRKSVLREHYEVKKHKYQSAMDDLSPYLPGFPYAVFVIIVGPEGVCTNMVLPVDVMQSLVYRFKVAKAIDESLITSGKKLLPIDMSASEATKNFIQLLGSIEVDGTEEYSIENYDDKVYGDINKAALSSVLTNSWSKAMDYIEERNIWKIAEGSKEARKNHSLGQIALQLADHIKKSDEMAPNGFNDHLKSIVNAPFVILKSSIPNSRIRNSALLEADSLGDGVDETIRLWISAVEAVRTDDDFVDNQEENDSYDELLPDPEEMMSFINDLPVLGPKPSDTRNLYCRVKVDIPKDDAIELGKVGIQGKQFVVDKEPSVKEYREQRQKPFSISTDVSDFQTLFDSDLKWMITPNMKENERLMRDRLILIQKAIEIHGEAKLSPQYMGMMTDMSRTPYMQWSSWISDISFELCLALRQGCKKNVFIIKKLKDWNCYVLIKPVRLSSKIFFSLLWFNEDELMMPSYGNVFRQTRSNGVVTWTDFISLDQCKIENWALCESRTFAMIPYWLEFHGLPPFSLFEDEAINKELLQSSLQMMLLYTCIEIADKSEIEQEASLFRYMFMKSLTAQPLIPEPEVVVEDFKKQVRSRLTIWIQQKLLYYCVYCAEGRIIISQEDLELTGHSVSTSSTRKLTWSGLINPYNFHRLSNPGDAVNLFYIGYVQNKNLNPEGNVFGKMLEKMLVLEDDLTPEIADRIGRENKPIGSDTKHEYNIDLLKAATRYAKEIYIPKLHGSGSLTRKIEDIVAKVANTNIEEIFATLKASSNFCEKFFVLTEEEYHRAKVIEKSQEYVHGDKTKVVDILKTCHKEVTDNGYMRIDIFQKNQHGGIREIYVLGFAERVVQWVIETIARGLCSLFPGETMTHPDNKKRLPEEHFKMAKSKFNNNPTMTFATSADASKWSQNMYSHKFAVMLCMLLPDYLHGFIWTSMEFWKNKYIMIPQSVIRRFHNNDELLFYNKYMEGLYKAYKGQLVCSWAGKDEAFIKLRTGMMQGILHYTSSLFHSIMNVYTEMQTLKVFSLKTKKIIQPLIMQSSDDSCEILTCEIPETIHARIITTYTICWCQIFKAILGEEVAIKNSSKKTAFNLQFVFEFNSAYHFGPSRYESDIKMLSSSLICTDRESIVDRHMEQYTQLTNFINAGGSIYSANFIQAAQALFNYRLMGSSITCRFRLLYTAYLLLPDPNLGFFLMDNPSFTGLCGYKYNLWMAILKTSVGKTYRHYLNDALTPTERNARPDLISTKNGILTKRAILSFGNRMKLKKIIERMELPEDWQELLDADPSLLFRRAQNVDEFKILCALKMHSPGVQESLSTGNITTRIMASSAYVALSTVMRSQGEWHRNEGDGLEEGRLSGTYNLSQLVGHELNIMLKETETVTDEQLKFLFPFHDEYLTLQARLSNCDYYIPKRKLIDYRRVITDVRVFDRDNLTTISPEIIMSAIWFQDNDLVRKPNYPMTYLKNCYRLLKVAIPWLSDDLEETLNNGPFNHINGLTAWLSQFHQKDKIVTIIGAPIISRRGSSSILSVIRQNFHKVYQLENIHVDNPSMNSSEYVALKQSILLLLSFPQPKSELERRCNLLLRSPLASKLNYNPTAVKSRYNMLTIFRDALDNGEPLEILSRISQCKVGIVGGYSIPQGLDNFLEGYYGYGVWVGKFYDKKVRLEVNSYYDDKKNRNITYLEKIFLEDIYPMDDILFCLRTWTEEHWVEVMPIPKKEEFEKTRTVAIKYSRTAGLIPGVRTYYLNRKFSDNIDGVPVIIDTKLMDNMGRISLFKLDIPIDSKGISRGTVKLMGRDPNDWRGGKENWMTLCRYVVNQGDYFGSTIIDPGIKLSSIMQAWIENSSLNISLASMLIRRVSSGKEDSSVIEHTREVLRNTFSKKGFRLGRKRDELPLLHTAQMDYSKIMEKKGVDISKKRVYIPDIREALEETIEEGTKDKKIVSWADETEKEAEENVLKLENADILTEEQIDKMFSIKDKGEITVTERVGVKKRVQMTMDALKRFFSPFDAEQMGGDSQASLIQKSALWLSSFQNPNILDTIQSFTATELEEEEVGKDALDVLPVELEPQPGPSGEQKQVAFEERSPESSISSDSPAIEEEDASPEEEDDDDIDWGDDDEEEEMIKNISKAIENTGSLYDKTYKIMMEAGKTDEGISMVNQEFEIGEMGDLDVDYFTSDNFFRDLEMVNSSQYQVDLSMSDVNMRNNLVKKEHLWFSAYVGMWCKEFARDLTKLFHSRILTKNLKDNKFMEVMDFMFPDIMVTEEAPVINIEHLDDFNPFDDDY